MVLVPLLYDVLSTSSSGTHDGSTVRRCDYYYMWYDRSTQQYQGCCSKYRDHSKNAWTAWSSVTVPFAMILLCCLATTSTFVGVEGFGVGGGGGWCSSSTFRPMEQGSFPIRSLFMTIDDDDDDTKDNGSTDDDDDDDGKKMEVLEDLAWRVEKLRLEEKNTKRFLQARPVYLPYEECRQWAIAFCRWDTAEDWREWIDMGEKRNSYIPARPDEYYGRRAEWISWDHFLGQDGSSGDDNDDDDRDMDGTMEEGGSFR